MIMDFLNMTKEQLENITKEDLNKLSEEEFLTYCESNKKVGNIYLFDGVPESEWHIKSDIDPKYTPVKFYGTFSKTLKNLDGKWQTWQGVGLVPVFKDRPVAVDEQKFSNLMESLGVSIDTLKDYFAFKPDYTNF
jgi:hypothetical protein